MPEESIIKEGRASEQPVTRVIESAGGSFDWITNDEKREKLYSISFESATLEYSSDNEFGGTMKMVKGVAYKDGKEASTFIANEAKAERGTGILKLTGGVTVTSTNPFVARLYCGEIVYDGNKQLFEAKGGIEFGDDNLIARGVEHLMANTDLTLVATPDMFKQSK